MSTFGFIELIAMLTTLGSFGVDANPHAPSAADVTKYAPAGADFMLHADLQAVVPGNYRRLQGLRNDKAVKDTPGLRAAVDDMLREIRTTAGMVRGFTGMDPTADLHSVTSWLTLPAAGEPQVLVVVRGNLPQDMVDRIAQSAGGRTTAIQGHNAFMAPDGSIMMVMHKGQLLLGTSAWVKERLDATWKSGRPEARVTALLAAKPFLVLVSRPSQAAVQRIAGEIGSTDNVAVDVVRGHAFAALALLHNGVTWDVSARDQRGYERAVMASEGMLELLRSVHFGARGLTRLAMAALPSYAGGEPALDVLLRHRDRLLKVVDNLTGDGNFTVDFKKQPRQRTLVVKARGKNLSDVLSVAGVLPFVAAGAYLWTAEVHEHEAADAEAEARAEAEVAARAKSEATEPTGAAEPRRGLDVQSVYREVKQAHGM